MAMDRFNVALDPIDSRGIAMRDAALQARQDSQAAAAAAAPVPPPETGGGAPAPAPEPGGGGGQGGSAPAPPPPPVSTPHGNTNYNPTPSAPTAVQGVQSSDVTGGVQGSFGQAGTAGFANRFGSADNAPATWFRRNASMAQPGGQGDFMKRIATSGSGSGAQTSGGGSGAAIDANLGVGGQPGDEDWQRFMQAVIQQRFRQ